MFLIIWSQGYEQESRASHECARESVSTPTIFSGSGGCFSLIYISSSQQKEGEHDAASQKKTVVLVLDKWGHCSRIVYIYMQNYASREKSCSLRYPEIVLYGLQKFIIDDHLFENLIDRNGNEIYFWFIIFFYFTYKDSPELTLYTYVFIDMTYYLCYEWYIYIYMYFICKMHYHA